MPEVFPLLLAPTKIVVFFSKFNVSRFQFTKF